MKSVFSPTRINYLYFGFLFICLAFVHASHVLLIEKVSHLGQIAFLVDAILQSLLEALFLLVVGMIVKYYLRRVGFYVYIAFTFLLFIGHLIDFFLIRLMDMTIWFGLSLMFDESLKNFVEILKSSNVSMTVWALAGTIGVLLPFVGIGIFLFCEKWEKKRDLTSSITRLVQLSCAIVAFLGAWDLFTVLPSSGAHYESLSKTLPLKATVFAPKYEKIDIRDFLPQSQIGSDEPAAISISQPVRKPDIYLFVIESLREDFITKEVAPHLSAFKEENISFERALSSANATHLSWFSIFYSKFPFHWTSGTETHRKEGSPGLKALKEMGYKINVYSSARLSFYEMDEKLFGEKRPLVDRLFVFGHGSGTAPFESDERTMNKLLEESQAHVEKNDDSPAVHVVFLESTHFDYSWPKESESWFIPIAEEVDYFKLACSKMDLEPLKNRYRNSIHYVDRLIGNFLDKLKQTDRGNQAVVVITADHGEEFYEDGHLFHASTLNEAQTHVPLYYKFGSGKHLPAKTHCSLTSHIDIFPTLLHYLLEVEESLPALQGESIFKGHRWPFALSARYKGERDPTEFLLHTGRRSLTLRFEEAKALSKSHLSVLSIKDLYNENTPDKFSVLAEEFKDGFAPLFSK